MSDPKKSLLGSFQRNGSIDPQTGMIGRTHERTQGCWNCFSEGELVLSRQGAVPIEEFNGGELWTNQGWQAASPRFFSGIKEIVEISTNYGATLRVTPDHRIMTDQGWMEARDLHRGHEIIGISEVSLSSKDEVVCQDAELLGALTGDGWIKTSQGLGRAIAGIGFGFKADRLDWWKSLLRHANERFGSKARPTLKNDGTFYQIEWRNQGAINFATKIDKHRVPDFIWRSSPNTIGSYLRGLFSTDGSLSLEGRPRVSFYQANKSLTDQVWLLLRSLGIQSHKRVQLRAPLHRDLYSLQIARTGSLQRFVEIVGFCDPRRQALLACAVHGVAGRPTPERVDSTTIVGRAATFDIAVPETESFFANGVLAHNCSHHSFDRAREMWKGKRQQDLAIAAKHALDSPMGEEDPKVKNIRRMVDAIDTGLATYNLGACDGTGVDKDGNPVDLVKTNYLCRLWNGAQGASVARAGQAPDKLPMELLEDDDKTS